MKMAVPVQVQDRVTFQKDLHRSLARGLSHQKETGEFCDIVLVIKSKRFHAHKAVLATASPYFRSMFTSRMKEQSSDEVNLSESLLLESNDSFREILDYIYCAEMEITAENSEDMMRIADFLLMDDIKQFCEQFYLLHGNLNLSNCISVSILAEHHNLPNIANAAMSMVKSRFHDHLISTEELMEIPEMYFFKLLRDKEITQFTSPDNLVLCILKWIKYQERTRRHCLLSLLSFVPLYALSTEVLDLLLHEPQISIDRDLVLKLESMQTRQAEGGIQQVDLLSSSSVPSKDHDTSISTHPGPLPIKKNNRSDLITISSFPRPSQKPGKSKQPTKSTSEMKSTLGQNQVLIAVNCNPGFRYIRVLAYNIPERKWLDLPVDAELFMHTLPSRLSVCSLALQERVLFMFLSHNLPYPSDMQRIHIMSLDLDSGQHYLHIFQHFDLGSDCCQTTLTDDRTVPPVMLCCRGYLCLVGNVDGTGHMILCDLATQTYAYYPVPGVRFISLARAVVLHERYLYVWCRHRFGHEEYCINKEVSLFRFDCRNKTFSSMPMPAPPGISYGEFADPHILTVDQGAIYVHTPDKASLMFDEVHTEWVTCHEKLSAFPRTKTHVDSPYHGYDVYLAMEQDIYILQNPAAYTTSMHSLKVQSYPVISLPPPPTDCISLITSGFLPRNFLHSLTPCSRFDDAYTRLVYNKPESVSRETEGSEDLSGSESDLDYDGYQYDEDIYGYFDDYVYGL